MIIAASVLALVSASALILGLGWSIASEAAREGGRRPALAVV